MTVLVTGSNGLVGNALKKLLGDNHIYHTRKDADLTNEIITKEEYIQEIEKFGDTLENLYIHIRKRYETRTKSINKRGRKPKQI